MLKVEKVLDYGWEAAIRGMRNPMNSHSKIDSTEEALGTNDAILMKKLVNAGEEHAKFQRMLNIYCDVTAPLYWWKEFDTYKIGTVANSESTMHKIASREFNIDMFSTDHLDHFGKDLIDGFIIPYLESTRLHYLETNSKSDWWCMIQALPSSFNQKRTLQFSYQVFDRIVGQRLGHKLDEWQQFIDGVMLNIRYPQVTLKNYQRWANQYQTEEEGETE